MGQTLQANMMVLLSQLQMLHISLIFKLSKHYNKAIQFVLKECIHVPVYLRQVILMMH